MVKIISIIPSIFILSLILFGSAPCQGGTPGYKKPKNCDRYECPAYDVVESQNDFEIRRYENASWVVYPVADGRSYLDAATRGFFRLFEYFHGKNKGQVRINMTAPVLVDVPKFPTSTAEANASSPSYAIYFYLPEKYQKDPPKADDKFIRRVNLPPYSYAAVRRFGGFATNEKTAEQALALKSSLKGTPWEAATSVTSYTVASYNRPFELTGRVNEVLFWFDKQS